MKTEPETPSLGGFSRRIGERKIGKDRFLYSNGAWDIATEVSMLKNIRTGFLCIYANVNLYIT